jgi:hypothetical protein
MVCLFPVPLSPSFQACSFSSTGAAWFGSQLRTSNDRYDSPSKLARFSLSGNCLVDVPLRASNEGLPRPRVARAQDTDQAVPLLGFHHFQSRIEFMAAGRATDAIRFDRKFV